MIKPLSSCNNLSDFADYEKNLNISHTIFHLKSRISLKDGHSIILNSTSLINKYYDKVLNTCIDRTFTDKELSRYRFQPKLFCYDEYNNIELWAILLKVNNMVSITEFNTKKIKVFTNDIFNVLNEILILEETNISNNKVSLNI